MNIEITGEGRPPTPRRRPIRLESARDARRFLSKIINLAYRGELPHGLAGKIGFLLSVLIRSFENDIETKFRGGYQSDARQETERIKKLMQDPEYSAAACELLEIASRVSQPEVVNVPGDDGGKLLAQTLRFPASRGGKK